MLSCLARPFCATGLELQRDCPFPDLGLPVTPGRKEEAQLVTLSPLKHPQPHHHVLLRQDLPHGSRGLRLFLILGREVAPTYLPGLRLLLPGFSTPLSTYYHMACYVIHQTVSTTRAGVFLRFIWDLEQC